MSTAPKYRAMRYGITRVRLEDTPNGVQYVQAEQALQSHPERMTDKLLHWARETPERTFLARRKRLSDGRTGDWEHLSYGRALAGARRIGQALLARNLSAERPVVILSENSLEQTAPHPEHVDAGLGVCHRCREIRCGHHRHRARRHRSGVGPRPFDLQKPHAFGCFV